MKKIASLIIAAVLMTTLVFQASATEIVNVVWPFAAGSVQAAKVRQLINAANTQQNQYQFVFSHHPGAGGAVGTVHTASAASLTVLATSSSFYTRPLMYHNSYDIDQFQLINTICLHSPLTLLSKQIASADQLKNRTSSVSNNPGAITQLFTQILAKNNPDLKFKEVPYSGTVNGIRDMLGGHIDTSVDLGTDVTKLLPGVNVVGITGTRNLPGTKTFASQGIQGVEHLTIGYYLFVPKTVDESTARKLNKIFNQAILSQEVTASCTRESGVVEITEFNQLGKVDRDNRALWKSFTKDFPKQ